MQLVLQHCYKTSCKAILRLLLPSFKAFNNLACSNKGLMSLVKRATSPFNSSCSSVAKQVACFLLPVLSYL